MRNMLFRENRPRWDEYDAFHIKDGPFVQFDTGEVICTRGSYDRDEYARKLYKDLNVEIRYTSDERMPNLYLPDGTRCARSWLDDRGSQTILIDWNFNMAIRLGTSTGSFPQYTDAKHWQASIPQRFRGKCVAYWAGELSKPQGSIGIKVTRPRKLTEAERAHLEGIKNYARARYAMEHAGAEFPREQWTNDMQVVDVDLALKTKIEKAPFSMKQGAIYRGYTKPFDVQVYPFLTVKE